MHRPYNLDEALNTEERDIEGTKLVLIKNRMIIMIRILKID